MRTSTLVLKNGINLPELRRLIAVESEVSQAVRLLGYDPDKQNLSVEACGIDRYAIRFGRGYIGVWDSRRKTFVD